MMVEGDRTCSPEWHRETAEHLTMAWVEWRRALPTKYFSNPSLLPLHRTVLYFTLLALHHVIVVYVP